jgi:hypothetical protein
VFTEPLRSNDRGILHADTQTDGRDFLKYVVEIGSGVMIYMSNFIKIGSDIEKLMGGIHRHTNSMVIT